MNLESLKPMLSMLKPLGVNIDEVVPNLITAINSHSENVGKKCFFIFDTTPTHRLQLSIYAQSEENGLHLQKSYQASTIEDIINIISALKNANITAQSNAIGIPSNESNGSESTDSSSYSDSPTDTNFHE